MDEVLIKRNRLIKDKYIALYYGFYKTTFIGWNNKGLKRRTIALKEHYISIINKIDSKDIIYYADNIKEFENDLRDDIISNKFETIL